MEFSNSFRDLLTEKKSYVCQYIKDVGLNPLLTELESRNVLVEHEVAGIKSGCTPQDKKGLLVDCIRKGTDGDYKSFLGALEKTNHKHLLEELQKTASSPRACYTASQGGQNKRARLSSEGCEREGHTDEDMVYIHSFRTPRAVPETTMNIRSRSEEFFGFTQTHLVESIVDHLEYRNRRVIHSAKGSKSNKKTRVRSSQSEAGGDGYRYWVQVAYKGKVWYLEADPPDTGQQGLQSDDTTNSRRPTALPKELRTVLQEAGLLDIDI